MVKRLRRYCTPAVLWRVFCMLIAVIIMGVALSLLIVADMGTDPFSTMNRGLAMVLPISFGTCQLITNVILIILMLLFQRKQIGIGTVANMTLVAYIADYLVGVWRGIPAIGKVPGLEIRIVMLIVGLVFFVLTAAVYMTADLGTAPYDALSFLLTDKLPFSFRWIRMAVDTCAVCIGWACGNKPGIMTVLMVLSLGPVVAWFAENVAGKLFSDRKIRSNDAKQEI